jgi:hypothetical protein
MQTRTVVSITQDSGPRFPVRGRLLLLWDKNRDKIQDECEAAKAASNRHFALACEIGKRFVAATIPRARFATSRARKPTPNACAGISLSPPPLVSLSSLTPSRAAPHRCISRHKSHPARPTLTPPAAGPILPPSPDQIAAHRFHRIGPKIQLPNTARTIRVVSETDTFDTWFSKAVRPVPSRMIARNGCPPYADNCHRRPPNVDQTRHVKPTAERQPVRLAPAAYLISRQPIQDMHERQLVTRKIICNGEGPLADVGCVLSLAFASLDQPAVQRPESSSKLFLYQTNH